MFPLPPGRPFEDEVELSPASDNFPFDYGRVSYYRPQARTPHGHQLVCDGVVIGWLCEADDGRSAFLVGMQAASRLRQEAETVALRGEAEIWTQSEFGVIAQQLQAAITDTSRLGSLVLDPANITGLQALDLARLVRELVSRPSVLGALAFEQSMVIESEGDLPLDPERLAQLGQEHLDQLSHLSAEVGASTVRRTSLWFDDGVLLLLDAGMAHLGMWTDVAADHLAVLANALSLLDHLPVGAPGEDVVDDDDLAAADLVKEGKGGVDALIMLLRAAQQANLAGTLRSTTSDGLETVDILLLKGMPVAMRARPEMDLETAIRTASAPTNELELRRLEGVTRLSRLRGTTPDFSLQAFTRHLSTVRSRSNKRRKELKAKVAGLYGFRLGLEELQIARGSWRQVEQSSVPAPPRALGARERVRVPSGATSTSRVSLLEEERQKAVSEKTRLARRLAEASAARERERETLEAVENRKYVLEGQVRDLSTQLDEAVQRSRTAEQAETDAQTRAARLARRVSELEQQVSERVAELASALRDAESAAALGRKLESIAQREAELKSSVDSEEERLRTLRLEIDAASRERRSVDDQIGEWTERVRKSGAELRELEERKEAARSELDILEHEHRDMRRTIETVLDRIDHEESRIQHLQGELKELMEERRSTLREITDVEAKRNQASAELRVLITQAEELSDVHEQALADIEEARELRRRIANEPLVQALLGADHRIGSLGDVISRIEDAKTKGQSIVLMDRAVERGLQIIQAAVEDVAEAPSVLLDAQVLALLESQTPEAASAVRGLTQWSVQQRLEQRLSEVVVLVVQDIEQLLDAYEEAVLMLHRMRDILRELRQLDMPESEILRLETVTARPEALPALAGRMRRLVQEALDEAYMRADLREPGVSAYDDRLTALEELVSRLDATGLTDPEPKGVLWRFQREGHLPSEDISLTTRERPTVRSDALEAMRAPWEEPTSRLADEPGTDDEEPGERRPTTPMSRRMKIEERTPEEEEEHWDRELACIDTELAAIERHRMGDAPVEEPEEDEDAEPMDELEAELAEIENELARLGY